MSIASMPTSRAAHYHAQHKQRLAKFAAAAERHAEHICAQRKAAMIAAERRAEIARAQQEAATIAELSALFTKMLPQPEPVAAEPVEAEKPAEKTPSIIDIQRAVAKTFGVTLIDILSARRTANVVLPRQVAVYLAKVLTLRSLPEIGRRFGGRDHTTVLYAHRKIERLIQRDVVLAEKVAALKASLE